MFPRLLYVYRNFKLVSSVILYRKEVNLILLLSDIDKAKRQPLYIYRRFKLDSSVMLYRRSDDPVSSDIIYAGIQ